MKISDASTLIQSKNLSSSEQYTRYYGLVKTAAVKTKIGQVENKIPDVNGLVKKTDYNAKISDIERKYLTASAYNNFMSEIVDAKMKEKQI